MTLQLTEEEGAVVFVASGDGIKSLSVRAEEYEMKDQRRTKG